MRGEEYKRKEREFREKCGEREGSTGVCVNGGAGREGVREERGRGMTGQWG